jgi:hypothetical protein
MRTAGFVSNYLAGIRRPFCQSSSGASTSSFYARGILVAVGAPRQSTRQAADRFLQSCWLFLATSSSVGGRDGAISIVTSRKDCKQELPL